VLGDHRSETSPVAGFEGAGVCSLKMVSAEADGAGAMGEV